jgi:hypothetical protein
MRAHCLHWRVRLSARSNPPRDRRMVLGFVRTLSRVGPRGRSAVGQARAAWQRIPAALRHQIAELAATAGCADELQRVTGEAAVPRSKDDK